MRYRLLLLVENAYFITDQEFVLCINAGTEISEDEQGFFPPQARPFVCEGVEIQ